MARVIDQRPVIVEQRTRIGDFEGDLLVGRNGVCAIATLVERTIRLVKLVHLGGDRRREATATSIRALLYSIPNLGRRTLTWDQGPEMARDGPT